MLRGPEGKWIVGMKSFASKGKQTKYGENRKQQIWPQF
jgi:hypothetical protein